jgi:ABC-type enterochelin transport system permease subunit
MSKLLDGRCSPQSSIFFKTVFRSGTTNQNAATLSRIPKTEDVVMSGQTQVIKALTTQIFAIEQEKY